MSEIAGITVEGGYARLSIDSFDEGFLVKVDSAGAGTSRVLLTREEMNSFLWRTLRAVNSSYEVSRVG